VETAFLHKDLKEDIDMNFLNGLQHMQGFEECLPDSDFVKLEKVFMNWCKRHANGGEN